MNNSITFAWLMLGITSITLKEMHHFLTHLLIDKEAVMNKGEPQYVTHITMFRVCGVYRCFSLGS